MADHIPRPEPTTASRVVTIRKVMVDSVYADVWELGWGIKRIEIHNVGVTIHTNFNSTLVPFANIDYVNY